MRMTRNCCLMVACAWPAALAHGQAANLRISEVDPHNDEVEVTNAGPAFTTGADRPFCHRFDYVSDVLADSVFGAGTSLVFSVANLDDGDSDLWLYVSAPFFDASNIIHGVKYGPQANVGRTALASGVGLWTGADQFAPAAPVGMTLAWDGFGMSPRDWYVDETPTMGSADSTPNDVVSSNLTVDGGMQDFEAMSLGDELDAITDWATVNSAPMAGMFTVRSVNDVLGETSARGASTRWLRIRDQDDANANRFYTSAIDADEQRNYTWTFAINIEEATPAGAATKPRLTVQHAMPGFVNAWGIEFSDTEASLIVTNDGGDADSVQLYTLASPTGVGDWVTIELSVDFDAMTVQAAANGGEPVSLPIDPDATIDTTRFRLCYRGEGTGNVITMLLDDISIATEVVVCEGDTNSDNAVGLADLLNVLSNWGSDDPSADVDDSGTVGLADLLSVLSNWGAVCE